MNYKEEKRGPTMILVQSPWGKKYLVIITIKASNFTMFPTYDNGGI